MHLTANHDRCSGCRTCRLACALATTGQLNPALASLRITGLFPSPGVYRVEVCDQCGACAEVCPVEAIAEDGGVYRVDPEVCIACGSCVEACPHGVLVMSPSHNHPLKCVACGQCVTVCPRDVLALVGE